LAHLVSVSVRTLDHLQLILAAAGKYAGTGVNHAAEAFTGNLELRALEGGNAAQLRYVATRSDGRHLHAETGLIACDASGELCLWPAMEEMPHLLAHRLIARDDTPAGATRFVFSSGNPDDRTSFREQIALEIEAGRGIVMYRHRWGLPAGEFDERSWCRFARREG
jgi:hypothetical protein